MTIHYPGGETFRCNQNNLDVVRIGGKDETIRRNKPGSEHCARQVDVRRWGHPIISVIPTLYAIVSSPPLSSLKFTKFLRRQCVFPHLRFNPNLSLTSRSQRESGQYSIKSPLPKMRKREQQCSNIFLKGSGGRGGNKREHQQVSVYPPAICCSLRSLHSESALESELCSCLLQK